MIGKLLGLAPWWVWLMAAAALMAFGAAGGFAAGRYVGALELVQEQRDRATERAAWADERASAMRASLQQAEKFLAQLQDQTDKLAKVQADGQAQLVAAQADRAAADRRAASLRDAADLALNALRRGTAEAPATAAECAAADAAARVFADLFSRADQAAGVMAGYADEARVAGNACVGADAVTR